MMPSAPLFTPVTQTLLVLALTAVAGLGLGRLRLFGTSLGVAGVLFAGLILGHFGFKLDDHLSEFIREFGLILFVYTIGVQVGPGFFASLRKAGLKLNALAAGMIVLGVLTALAAHYAGGVDGTVLPGRHDGMGAFDAGNGNVLLVRNHEVNNPGPAFGNAAAAYDPMAQSGTTTIEVPSGLPTAAGSMIAVDLSADSAEHESWKRPIRTYFRRTGSGWKLIGLERMPENLAQKNATRTASQ